MQLDDLIRIVNETFPPETAVHGDSIGVQVASRRASADNILVCLEVTDETLQEAIALASDCIITFHPLIYQPLHRLDRSSRVPTLVADLIINDIAVLCVHTAFDAFAEGTNHVLAQALGLTPTSKLPKAPIGIVAATPEPMSLESFAHLVSNVCGGPVRFSDSNITVTSVAIVAGSGMSFYDNAVESGADVFLTADTKYHAFHAASGVIGLVDAGHFEMEQFVPRGIVSALSNKLDGIAIQASSIRTNPSRCIYIETSTTLN